MKITETLFVRHHLKKIFICQTICRKNSICSYSILWLCTHRSKVYIRSKNSIYALKNEYSHHNVLSVLGFPIYCLWFITDYRSSSGALNISFRGAMIMIAIISILHQFEMEKKRRRRRSFLLWDLKVKKQSQRGRVDRITPFTQISFSTSRAFWKLIIDFFIKLLVTSNY